MRQLLKDEMNKSFKKKPENTNKNMEEINKSLKEIKESRNKLFKKINKTFQGKRNESDSTQKSQTEENMEMKI